MRYLISIFVLCFLFTDLSFSQETKQLTLEDIFKSGKFRAEELRSAQWLADGTGFVFMKQGEESKGPSIYKHEARSGRETKWIDGAKLLVPGSKEVLTFSAFRLSASGKKIVFKTDARRVWRRFDDGRFFIYDTSAQSLIPVYNGKERIRHVRLAPDDSRVGYVLNSNIYLKDLVNENVSQITKDGSDTILNGLGDWVYEEEFGLSKAWSWSPDGQYIAFHRFNQSQMQTFSWTEFEPLHGLVKTVPYPLAGDPISSVKIGVYQVNSGRTVWMDTGAEENIYIPRVRWTKDEHMLMIERMNRRQNKLEFLLGDVRTGQTKLVFTETDPAWISLTDDIFFLKSGHQFIRTSESDGFNHIYLYDLKNKTKTALTRGQWEVSKVYGVNEQNADIYFQANKDKVENRQLYKVNLQNRALRQITQRPGTHDAVFAPDYSVFIHTFCDVRTPLKTFLAKENGDRIRTLMENNMEGLQDYSLAYPEFLSFKTSDGVEIKAMITKPVDFDPAKKYPVLVYGYSGPASQLVRNTWGRTISKLWYTLLTQKGYIIFTLDQRGTGGRGKAFKNLAYGDIGKYMLIDHIEGVKYLRSLPYVDGSRIGIWGWSGGGYLTLMAMTKGSPYFKAGIAVAPVSDFRLYDNIWTERYMGLPGENKAGYDSTSALTYTDRYRDGLLIIHGASDDNVHMQNTMKFIEKLQLAGKQFDLMIYPGRNHSLLGKGSVYFHLYSLMTRFILENL